MRLVPATRKTRPEPDTKLEQWWSRQIMSPAPDVWCWKPAGMPFVVITVSRQVF